MDTRVLFEALEYGAKQLKGQPLFEIGRSGSKWEEIRTSPNHSKLLQEVVEVGESLRQEPIGVLPFSKYKLFDTTGNRIEFEKAYFKNRLRLNTFAILSLAYGKPQDIEALEDIIWAMCDEYTWCLPAHLGGHSLKSIDKLNQAEAPACDGQLHGKVKPHRQTIDLFASETAFTLAEICSLLETRLSEVVMSRARKEIRERVLEPFCELGSFLFWEQATHNWSAVCSGSIGSAALYLIQDSAGLTPIIGRVLQAMECYLSGFDADGACTEGIGYWNYGFGYYTYFADLLKQRTGGAVDLFTGEKIKQIALFQQKCYLNEDWTVSFSDASLHSSFSPGLTGYLKTIYPEVEMPPARFASSYTTDHCARWPNAVRNFVWSLAPEASEEATEAVYYLQDAEWLVSRTVSQGHVVSFAAKGGHNAEPHNHNDVGHFMLHVNGTTLLTDTGAGEYTKSYFGEQRYSYIGNRSKGHSVPIIEGIEQQEGKQFAAQVLDISTSENRDVFALELAGAYPSSNLQSLIRTFQFDKKGAAPQLELIDRYRFEQAPDSIVERFVSFTKPEMVSDGRVRLQQNNAVTDLIFDASQLQCSVERVDFMNHSGVREDLYLLDLTVAKPGTEETVRVQFLPGTPGASAL
ncbi:heparinase II/III family protein [Paenibacillus rigui]|uniref:Heparinase n=1 Tax=Paenibacillus rigui TaxID=554312 RepID=A0A229UU07_9BACL|nr:heparinase II/III family protein [Paenibacillus rigui]OXM86860.1 hypothetical protein CF651_08400 [Paenibacillus rigui]